MLSPEQTTIRRLDSEIDALKRENEKLRTYKKEVQLSVIALLKHLVSFVPTNYKSVIREQITELEDVCK